MNSVSANTLCVMSVPPPPQALNCDAEMLNDKEKAVSCTAKEVENYFDFLGQDENSDRCIVSFLTLPRICFRVILYFLPVLGHI